MTAGHPGLTPVRTTDRAGPCYLCPSGILDLAAFHGGRTMRIDIWSDVICPFCWIGKRHLETALESFRADHPDTGVEVVWRAYELHPSASRVAGDERATALAQVWDAAR